MYHFKMHLQSFYLFIIYLFVYFILFFAFYLFPFPVSFLAF